MVSGEVACQGKNASDLYYFPFFLFEPPCFALLMRLNRHAAVMWL
jgi:hypothetical protein